MDLLLEPDEIIENKELRNKKALLHLKKTGTTKHSHEGHKESVPKEVKEKKSVEVQEEDKVAKIEDEKQK